MDMLGGLWNWIENGTERTAERRKEYHEQLQDGKVAFLHRIRDKEPYYELSGASGPTSFRTIWNCDKGQRKLMFFGLFWLFLQFQVYSLEANYLVHLTFNSVAPESPSYPGAGARNGTDPFDHKRLYDVGFEYLPDWSHRPPWLKIGFVDVNVYLGQFLPWILALLAGRTEIFIHYVGILGTINMLKGIIQLVTILPPARGGEGCWDLNFSEEQLAAVVNNDFFIWIWKDFPSYFTMGAAHGCNDMLWSGHTAQTILGWLFITDSLWAILGMDRKVYLIVRAVIGLYVFTYILAVLTLRMHYTIDVVVAALIAFFMSTHTRARLWIWRKANKIVGNEKAQSQQS